MTKDLKIKAVARAKELGLKVIPSRADGRANETCSIKISKGKAILEKHTVLAEDQYIVRNAKQNVRAAIKLGQYYEYNVDYWNMLTKEQQTQISLTIHGYEYEIIK